jgi:4-amino-4-deoxy-L-arabinose transferase-like glycosyltransferase
MISTRRRWQAGAIVASALVIRVGLVVATRHTYAPAYDAAEFNQIAISLSHGHGFGPTLIKGLSGPSAFRTPLWPGLLAGVYWIVGVKMTVARLVVALLSTVVVALIGAVTSLLLGQRAGLLTLGLAAIYPPLIMAGYGLNYEELMGVMVFGSLLCVLLWRRRPASWWLLVVSGLLSGGAILCRENAGLVLVPIAIIIVLTVRQQPAHPPGAGTTAPGRARRVASAGRVALVVGCGALTVLPWTIRNAEQLHAFIPVSDSPQMALAGVYNPISPTLDGAWVPYGGSADAALLKGLPRYDNEAVYSDREGHAAEVYAEHHVAYVPELAFYNTVRLFDLRGPTDSNWLAPLIPWPVHFIELSVVSFYVVALIGLFGLVTGRLRRVPWFVWTFPLLWWVTIALSTSILQYRFIIEPFFVLAAAVTVLDLWDSRRSAPATGQLGP